MLLNKLYKKKLYLRSLLIVSGYENKEFSIHNGISFKKILITNNMIGHKLGEFFFTKKRPIFKAKKKKF